MRPLWPLFFSDKSLCQSFFIDPSVSLDSLTNRLAYKETCCLLSRPPSRDISRRMEPAEVVEPRELEQELDPEEEGDEDEVRAVGT